MQLGGWAKMSAMVLTLCFGVGAQGLLLGVDGAATKVRDDNLRIRLRVGFGLTAEGGYAVNDFLQLGLRYSYNQWAPARDFFKEAISDTLNLVDIDGNTWSMEIAPCMRLVTPFRENGVNLFAQAGAGLYIIKNQTTVQATGPLAQARSVEFGSGTESHFGFSVGGGVNIGEARPFMVRLYPLYHYVAREKDPDKYWTFNAGIVVGFGQ